MGIPRGSTGATAGAGAVVGRSPARRGATRARPASTFGRTCTAARALPGANGRADMGGGTPARGRFTARSDVGRTPTVSSGCLAVLGRTAPGLRATAGRPASTLGSGTAPGAVLGIAGRRADGSARPLRTGESACGSRLGFGPARGCRSSATCGRLGRAGSARISAGAFLG
jgi:hypothetical protein